MEPCYNLHPITQFKKCTIEVRQYRRLVATENIKRGEVILADECSLSIAFVEITNIFT